MPAQPPPDGIDVTTPSAARMYNYYIGGKDHYAVDREAADALYQRIPELKTMARANRRFLERAVDYLARAGIRQFIDLGPGLPTTENNTHQIAHRHVPDPRVVYVDNDPLVVAHGPALMEHTPETTGFVHADIRDPDRVLHHPELVGRIDFAHPVAVLMVAVLHFIRDVDQPYQLVDHYRRHLCPGSYVALSHVEHDTNPQRAAYLEEIYANTSAPGQTRSIAEIAHFFNHMELVEPGVVHVGDWHRQLVTGPHHPPQQAWVVGAVARIPHAVPPHVTAR